MDDKRDIEAAAKIADGALRELFAEDGGSTASVIVEVAVPEASIEIAGGEHGVGSWRAVSVASEADEDRRHKDDVVQRARHFIEEISGADPVWLSASDAFVIDVGREQLAALVRSPLVRRVSLNQLRR
jgi:hypothetical protein